MVLGYEANTVEPYTSDGRAMENFTCQEVAADKHRH